MHSCIRTEPIPAVERIWARTERGVIAVHGLTSEVGACENATAQVFVFEPQGGWILAWGQARVAVYAWGGKLVVSAWEHAQVNVYAIATDVEVYKNDEAQVSVFR